MLSPHERCESAPTLQGVLRIEATGRFGLQASADLYAVGSAIVLPSRTHLERFAPFWYPQLPAEKDSWYGAYDSYLCGTEAALPKGGNIAFAFARHAWERPRGDFGCGDKDTWIILRNTRKRALPPQGGLGTLKLFGQAYLGGLTYDITACKTSPYQRGCYLVVEEMEGTRWPVGAYLEDGTRVSFSGVFRAHGVDIRGHISPGKRPSVSPLVADEAFAEINQPAFKSVPEHSWRMRIVIGQVGETPPGREVLGVMRDNAAPYREAAVGFYKANLPCALGVPHERLIPQLRGRPLGETPLAFLRTLLHEAGHIFGLQHGADVLGVGPGRTIMDPTERVIALSAADGPPYPLCAEFAFSDHDQAMLAHAPDAQLAPGRMQYNWLPGLTHGGVFPWRQVVRWRSRFD
jgi:hypothetical protein